MRSGVIDTGDALELEAIEFFDNFVTAFATFNGEQVAGLFSHPYMAVNSEGNSTILESPVHTSQYFQKYLDDYKSSGSRSCRYDSLQVFPIGTSSALASVTWSLLNASGATIESWSESYCVTRTRQGMLAYASIDHAA